MSRKLIFIDVDGTLCDSAGEVPISARDAIQKSRDNGHLVYICTGRSKPEITEDISSIGFDGMICAGGGYIEINNEIVIHEKMPAKHVVSLLEYFDNHYIAYYIESNDGLFGSKNCRDVILAQATKGLEKNSKEYNEAKNEMNWFCEILDKYHNKSVDYNNVNKVSFISNGHPYEDIFDEFKEELEVYRNTVPQFGRDSGEVGIKGINKSTAINCVIEYLNIDRINTLAYGDGENDISMFKTVNHCVAMRNAKPELIKIAKEVTYEAGNDGIYSSFKKNNLI
ncbi:MAG: HAD family hydrolase [Clostridium sp.]|uniref:HAD family hydrolase n=1 Tax=Clostridium sp. TaxID=1506 RepID=UPI0029066387|nr:HAD family hydrolase [Clostridium sp.]MDU5108938.1 HAD family hydrolase [Clostridium sp.]